MSVDVQIDNQGLGPTGYPHIVKVAGVSGEEALLEGTRIAVWHIVDYYYRVGMSVEDMVAEWEYLSPSHFFSALAYYHDNKAEIDEARQRNSYENWHSQHAQPVA